MNITIYHKCSETLKYKTDYNKGISIMLTRKVNKAYCPVFAWLRPVQWTDVEE